MPRVPIGFLLAAVGLLTFNGPGLAAGATLTFSFLDVGQGDATLVSLPTGEHVLIDGATTGQERRLEAYLKARGVKALDMVIITHPVRPIDIGGLDRIWTGFPIRLVLDAGESTGTLTYAKALRAISKAHIPLKLGRAGLVKQYGPVRLEALGPSHPLITGSRSDSSTTTRSSRNGPTAHFRS